MSDRAIVIDGFHRGHVVQMPYYPSVKLLKPTVVMVDTCCGGDEMSPVPHKILEYKECFRSVDRKVVLYSTTGDSADLKGFFPASFRCIRGQKKPRCILATTMVTFEEAILLTRDLSFHRGAANSLLR